MTGRTVKKYLSISIAGIQTLNACFETKFKSFNRAARSPFGAVVCAGAVMLIAASAPAQNLFVAGGYDGTIYEYTPGGVQSTFASGLTGGGLAFNSAGNLFETDTGSGNIYEFTPGGMRSTFATGYNNPGSLAFDSAGNLFAADSGNGNIYK